MTDVGEVITRVHREEWARVVATLARRLGDLDIAEEMAAEAFATAVERWPVGGVPPSPCHGPADHPREGEDQGGDDPISRAVT